MEAQPIMRSRIGINRTRYTAEEGVENGAVASSSSSSVNSGSDDAGVVNTFCCCPIKKVEKHGDGVPAEAYGHLDAKLESLNYDNCENEIYLAEEKERSYKFLQWKAFSRWLVMLLIGVVTGLIACAVDIVVDILSRYKFKILVEHINYSMDPNTDSPLTKPLMIWVAWNVVFVAFASFLTVYVEPASAGSGIPQIKCFLNGVKIPNVVRSKTLFCKIVGVTCSVLGGLVVGKEGPMIHSGAVVAAGISQGRSTTFGCDLKCFEYFRSDQEKRDFVSGGAAAGVSAAFGTPVGGVLFSLEEGASFWNQALTWRIFFASLVSTFTINLVLNSYHSSQFSYTGLVNFGKFQDMPYTSMEIPIFIFVGVVGGLLGALFNFLNLKLTHFRIKNISNSWMKFLEALLIASSTTAVAFTLIYLNDDCQPIGKDPNPNPLQLFCADGKSSSMATLWFQSPESSLKSLFHDSFETYTWLTLCLFGVFYFLLATWTYGMAVSSGLFIPSLVVGASWGRLFGMLLKQIFKQSEWIQPGKFALLGAASQLGGTVRMTLSLTVILLEATGNISYGLPLMIVLNFAKWTADIFNKGIYDSHIHLQGVPFLEWEPPKMTTNTIAREVMSHPVVVVAEVESVSRVVEVLSRENHNGFPVVLRSHDFTPSPPAQSPNGSVCESFGLLTGLITRAQLIVLLKMKFFIQHDDNKQQVLKASHFRDVYPRYPKIQDVDLSESDMSSFIDLRSVMNPAPYAVYDNTSLSRIFKLFRGLGLSHLMVVNKNNLLIGIVTRKDLARYHCYKKHFWSDPVVYSLPMSTGSA